jgi:hypothetical protein
MGITVSEQAFPCFGDMDGDNLPDLLLGYTPSSTPPKVRFYRNNGSAGNPLFTSYIDIVEPVYPGSMSGVNVTPGIGDVDATEIWIYSWPQTAVGRFFGAKVADQFLPQRGFGHQSSLYFGDRKMAGFGFQEYPSY